MSEAEDALVIGVGDRNRGDDGAGLAVAHAVRKALPRARARARVLDAGLDSAPLLDGFSGSEIVVLVDVAESRGEPGRISRYDATKRELPVQALREASARALGVREAIEMARVLGRMPRRKLVVIAIEGSRFEHGDALSDAVERAVPEAARMVILEIGDGSPRT